MIQFTRAQYLNKECSHEQYYNQFVNDTIKQTVLNMFTKEKIREEYNKDSNLNTLPLSKWDKIAQNLFNVSPKLKEAGDYLTLAGGVCIAKSAARQIIKEQ